MLVSVAFLLCSLPVSAEKMYQISESELAALEKNNSELKMELQNQVELTVQLQTELSEVKSWLATSEKARIEAESSLTTATLSFDEYEREVQGIIRGNKIAEVIEKVAIGIGAAAVGYAIGTF